MRPGTYVKRLQPHLIAEANTGKNYAYCQAELLKCIAHTPQAALSILSGIHCHNLGYLGELESKLQDTHPHAYAQKMQDYLIGEANAGREQPYCGARLTRIIAADMRQARPILDAISPYQIGYKGLSTLRIKLWEILPTEYAEKLRPVLFEKVSAGTSHAYCASWFAKFISHNQKSSVEILDGIEASQLCAPEFDQLREILSEQCGKRYGGKMAVHHIREINTGRDVEQHSLELANLIETNIYDGRLAVNEINPTQLSAENRLRITLQQTFAAAFALREGIASRTRPQDRRAPFLARMCNHS